MLSPMRDLAAHIKAFPAGASDDSGAPALIEADDSGTDNVERTGPTIDTQDFHSGVYNLEYVATLTAEETLSLEISIQESDDDSTYDDPEVLMATAVVATGPEGDGDVPGSVRIDFDVASRKRYVQFVVTADLSSEEESATDFALYTSSVVLGGARVLPVED